MKEIRTPFSLKKATIDLFTLNGLSFPDFGFHRLLCAHQLRSDAFDYCEYTYAVDGDFNYDELEEVLESYLDAQAIPKTYPDTMTEEGHLATTFQETVGVLYHPQGLKIEFSQQFLDKPYTDQVIILAHEVMHTLQEYEAFKPEYKSQDGAEIKEEIVANLGAYYLLILFGLQQPTHESFSHHHLVTMTQVHIEELVEVIGVDRDWVIEELNNETVRRVNKLLSFIIENCDAWPNIERMKARRWSIEKRKLKEETDVVFLKRRLRILEKKLGEAA